MATERESTKQCRFYEHFETETDVELVFYNCTKDYFPRTDDREAYPDLAPTCPDFALNDSLGSRWAKLPQDYKDRLERVNN